MSDYPDQRGRQIAIGDCVLRTAVDDGAPLWSSNGTVVGFGRKLIRVQWDGFGYDDRKLYHSTSGHVLRVQS